MGIKKPSILKNYLRDFERYIGTYYGIQILKIKKGLNYRATQDPESPLDKTLFSQS